MQKTLEHVFADNNYEAANEMSLEKFIPKGGVENFYSA